MNEELDDLEVARKLAVVHRFYRQRELEELKKSEALEKLKKSRKIVSKVIRFINEMMDIKTSPDKELLARILAHCFKNEEGSRYKLLDFVHKEIRSMATAVQDPLVLTLEEIYQEEYRPIEHDPIRLEIKKQMDSLGFNAEPKDDFIHMILDMYLTQYGIHAFLIIGTEPTTPPSTVSHQGLFSSISSAELSKMHLVKGIFAQIREKIELNSKVDRIFFIIRQEVHYTVIDYQASMEQCIIIDAAGDDKQLNFLEISKHIPQIKSVIYVKKDTYHLGEQIKYATLQKDMFSCSIFSLDHVLSAGLCPDLHAQFSACKADDGQSKNIGYITWLQAPPQLVRNAQSPSFIEKYVASQPKETREATDAYLKQFSFRETVRSMKQMGGETLFACSDSPPPSPGFNMFS